MTSAGRRQWDGGAESSCAVDLEDDVESCWPRFGRVVVCGLCDGVSVREVACTADHEGAGMAFALRSWIFYFAKKSLRLCAGLRATGQPVRAEERS